MFSSGMIYLCKLPNLYCALDTCFTETTLKLHRYKTVTFLGANFTLTASFSVSCDGRIEKNEVLYARRTNVNSFFSKFDLPMVFFLPYQDIALHL